MVAVVPTTPRRSAALVTVLTLVGALLVAVVVTPAGGAEFAVTLGGAS